MAHTGPRRQDTVVGPLALPAALEPLAAQDAVSACALERFAGCPVSWLVDEVLEPEKLEPDPEAMVRGSYAHKVLEATFRALREQTGDRRVTPGQPAAGRAAAAGGHGGRARASSACRPTRPACAPRCGGWSSTCCATCATRPAATARSSPSTWSCASASRTPTTRRSSWRAAPGCAGVIDRVDTWDGWALVRDYKSGKADKYKLSDWRKENRFQAALYMLVAERALGLKPAGGVYVPLRGTDRRARGHGGRRAGRASWAATSWTATWCPRPSSPSGSPGRRSRSARWPRACAPAIWTRARTAAPGAAAARTPRSAGWRRERDPGFTDEQARAVGRRDGSVLVSAGAGSGKTSVLVERFVQAVLAGRMRRSTRSWPSPSPRRPPRS